MTQKGRAEETEIMGLNSAGKAGFVAGKEEPSQELGHGKERKSSETSGEARGNLCKGLVAILGCLGLLWLTGSQNGLGGKGR